MRGHLADLRDLGRVTLSIPVDVAKEFANARIRLFARHALRRIRVQIPVDQSGFHRIGQFAHPDSHAFCSSAVASKCGLAVGTLLQPLKPQLDTFGICTEGAAWVRGKIKLSCQRTIDRQIEQVAGSM